MKKFFALFLSAVTALAQWGTPSIPTDGLIIKYALTEGSGQFIHNNADSPTYSNLLGSPQNAFSTVVWAVSGVTVTDGAGTGPTGFTDASRLQIGSGSSKLIYQVISFPAGQYTFSVYVMSNTGGNQTFRLEESEPTQHFTANQTATTSWQRFSYTFTAAGTITAVAIANDSSFNASDILIWGAQLEAGATATTYRGDKFHAVLGNKAYTDAADPTWTGKALNHAGGLYQNTTVGDPVTLTTWSAYALVKWTGASQGSAGGAILNTQGITEYIGLGGIIKSTTNSQLYAYLNNSQILGNHSIIVKDEWHVVNVNYDGSLLTLSIDGSCVSQSARSSVSVAVSQLVIGCLNATFNWGGEIGAILVYNKAHGLGQQTTTVYALKYLANSKGLQMVPIDTFVQFEGDSITASSTDTSYFYGYPNQALRLGPKQLNGVVTAVNGSTIADYVTRQAVDNTYRSMIPKTKRILSVLDGPNDLQGLGAATWFANMKAYCLQMRACGWKICIGTILPTNQANHNTQRAIANTDIRNDSSFYDALADYDNTIMGIDATALNATYYNAGVHPTDVGQAILGPVCQTAINSIP